MTDHRIVSVDAIVVRGPRLSQVAIDENPANEALIVVICSASGLVGFGECNHHAQAARAFLLHEGDSSMGRGVAPFLVGNDPRDHAALNAELYRGNLFSARRGIGWGVLAAVDAALWDLCARIANVPLWRLLWGDAVHEPESYVTVYGGASPWPESQRRLRTLTEQARALGYSAAKVEPLIDCVPEEYIGDYVSQARAQLGSEIELLIDLGYRMPTAARALSAIEKCVESNPLMIETPCAIDALGAWRETARSSPVPIAGAELLEHPADFTPFIDAGVKVLQPWINRLGVTGTLDVISQAHEAGRRVILAGWNATAIGTALGVHLAAGLPPGGIVLEHAPGSIYNFPLRPALGPELQPVSGRFALPATPGLGLNLKPHAIAELRTHQPSIAPRDSV